MDTKTKSVFGAIEVLYLAWLDHVGGWSWGRGD